MLRRQILPLALAPVLSGAKRVLDYEVWDVFSDQPLLGNQLAVFFGAEGLPDETLLAIAREMNYSESTFVSGRKTRIFLKTEEIPFAGHPVLGTAFALWERGGRRAARVTLECKIGPVPVDFRDGVGMMTQPEAVFAETHDPAVIAPLLGARASDIDSSVPIQNVSTGRPNLLVLFRSLAALQAVKYDWPAIDRYFAGGDKQRAFYLLTRETVDKSRQFHARKILRNGEDPVTGSAAGCAIAWMVQHGLVPSGQVVRIEQGTEIQRSGEAMVSAERQGGRVSNVKVGGKSVRVMQGKFRF